MYGWHKVDFPPRCVCPSMLSMGRSNSPSFDKAATRRYAASSDFRPEPGRTGDRRRLPSHAAHFHSLTRFWLCQFRLPGRAWRSSANQGKARGSLFALPAHRLYYPVDMWPRSEHHMGRLRRSARCSVITQRARKQQRPSSATASVSACAASCFVARVRARREEKTASPIPAESHVAGCMPAARKESI
jgi:hypothetical protein